MKKVKVYYQNQIKRFSMSNRASYSEFVKILENLFTNLKVENQEVLYRDSDGEWINFNSQIEWNEAMELTDTLLISIPTLEPQVNGGVTCDGCKKESFRGKRYKCKVCPDFDYCEECFQKNRGHSSHPFIEFYRSKRILPCCKAETKPLLTKEEKKVREEKIEENEEFSIQLNVLKGMGFDNSEKNLQLLKKHSGNLQKIVDEQLNLIH